MKSTRLALLGLVSTLVIGSAVPALAADDGMGMMPKCTAGDPAVEVNTKTNEYVMAINSPTAAGSFPATGSAMPAYMKMMCMSAAKSAGAKPAYHGMQMQMGAMMMSLNAMDLTSAQRSKIESMMHADAMHEMKDVSSVLTSAQQDQLNEVMRHMAFPGP